MKQIVLTLILLTGIFSAKAQDNLPRFRYGVNGGPTFGVIKSEIRNAGGVGVGYDFGVTGEFRFYKNLSFVTGINYLEVSGTEATYDRVFAHWEDYKFVDHYIEIPVTFKLRSNKWGKVNVYGQAGLSNGFRVQSKLNDAYRAGLIVGGGLEFDVKTHTTIVVGLFYDHSFTRYDKGSRDPHFIHFAALNFGILF